MDTESERCWWTASHPGQGNRSPTCGTIGPWHRLANPTSMAANLTRVRPCPLPERQETVFVEYAVDVDLPEKLVAELLFSHAAEMEGMGEAAYRQGEELRGRVGPGGLLAKEVVIAIGKPFMSRRGAVLPVRWRATGAEALFPSLEGELSIESAEDGATNLHLRATYRPPLGAVGSLMDRLVLARLARSTAANWVDGIADWLLDVSAEREDYLHQGAGTDD